MGGVPRSFSTVSGPGVDLTDGMLLIGKWFSSRGTELGEGDAKKQTPVKKYAFSLNEGKAFSE